MPSFSFDIVSDFDKAEMNNVFAGTEREIGTRYDFKGTPAAIEWMDDKKGFKIIGAGQWQCDAVLDIVRKKLAAREQSSKVLDTSKTPVESNLKTTWEIPFKQGLSQDNAKSITKTLREEAPKAKTQIQGDMVRVTSASKDELQKVIILLRSADYDFPLDFINYR
ncbi:MAG TPA: YajQ family cyclic di-GMP-binding protein [Candidatus Saccharimonadales bacterium]|nr:YajQ family cyclic di-GMP-binding protein [Candidatus Saccharimonadales bacterium]